MASIDIFFGLARALWVLLLNVVFSVCQIALDLFVVFVLWLGQPYIFIMDNIGTVAAALFIGAVMTYLFVDETSESGGVVTRAGIRKFAWTVTQVFVGFMVIGQILVFSFLIIMFYVHATKVPSQLVAKVPPGFDRHANQSIGWQGTVCDPHHIVDNARMAWDGVDGPGVRCGEDMDRYLRASRKMMEDLIIQRGKWCDMFGGNAEAWEEAVQNVGAYEVRRYTMRALEMRFWDSLWMRTINERPRYNGKAPVDLTCSSGEYGNVARQSQ